MLHRSAHSGVRALRDVLDCYAGARGVRFDVL